MPVEEGVQELVTHLQASPPIDVAIGIVILILGLGAIKVLMNYVNKYLDTHKRLEELHTVFRAVIRVSLTLLVVITAASTMGIPTTSMIALVSVVGIAVSLAVQGVLTNLAAGIIIMATHPFKLGDFVTSGEMSGTVTEIGFLHTRLLGLDGQTIYVPNNLLYSNNIINFTGLEKRRVAISVSASYDNSPDEVREACLYAISQMPEILEDPAPSIVLNSYEDHAIKYNIWVWVKNSDFGTVKFGLNEKLYQAFREKHVEMTYPHINVHMN